MTDQSNLTDRLATAAADAVRKRRTAIEDGAMNLRAITVEITPANRGAVLDVETYLSWKSVVRAATKGERN